MRELKLDPKIEELSAGRKLSADQRIAGILNGNLRNASPTSASSK